MVALSYGGATPSTEGLIQALIWKQLWYNLFIIQSNLST